MTAPVFEARRWWAPAGVILLAVATRFYGLSGDMPPDALVYAQYASNLADGSFLLATDSWYAHRFPVFVPVAGCYAIFGVGTLSTTCLSLLLSLGQVIFAMAVGWRYFGRGAGLLAGLVLAFYPLDVIEAGRLLPDMVMGGLLGWAGALWLLATRTPGNSRGAALFVSGICLALAVVVRPYALLLLFYLIADAALRRIPARSVFWVVAGVAAVAVPLLTIYQLETGDALYRVRVVTSTYSSGTLAEDPQWLYYIAHIWSPKSLTGLFPLLLVGCSVFLLIRPDRVRLSLLLWIVLFISFLQLGSMSFTEFVPILKRTRFLTAISLPSAVLIGSVLSALAGLGGERLTLQARAPGLQRTARVALVSGLIVLLAASLWRIDLDRSSKTPRVEAIEAVAAEVRRQEDTPVMLDHWRSAIRLAYYLGFERGSHYYRGADDGVRMERERMPEDSRFGYLSWFPDLSRLPEGLVLIDDRVLAQYRASGARGLTFRSGEIPAYALDPPASWEILVDGGGLSLYRVGSSDPALATPPADAR